MVGEEDQNLHIHQQYKYRDDEGTAHNDEGGCVMSLENHADCLTALTMPLHTLVVQYFHRYLVKKIYRLDHRPRFANRHLQRTVVSAEFDDLKSTMCCHQNQHELG